MTVLKCKRCGGDLRPKPEDKIVVCEYCMAQQTIPTGDDEKKMRKEWLEFMATTK